MALVIVLTSLVFLVALALAFLSSSMTELKSSKAYAEGSRVQLLAQSALNLAMAQIAAGTKGVDGSGNVLAWASQPGMIRTYDTGGNPSAYYRLYSWDVMTGAGAYNPFASNGAVPADWSQQRALFTDLNQPLTIGTIHNYPIIDGNSLTVTGPDGGKTYASPGVAGFSVSASAPLGTGSTVNPVPMPVKWLYVLADGKIVSPAASSGDTATFSSPNAPTAGNPIVGRIAFWTDDETCKININTAADAFSTQSGNTYRQTYWDTPRFSSIQDYNFALSQPSQHEYQRYPGHPSTVALSTVFPAPSGYTSQQWAEEIYKIAPRITGGSGSSQGGASVGTASSVLTTDTDRLFSSVDELIFKQTLSGGSRSLNDPVSSGNPQVFNKDLLERAKFFLTAGSRAPDLNLWNKPRVCIWPINLNDDNSHRTVFDRLIAFCSTIGGHLFYFQRSDPQSPTADLPVGGSATGLGRNRQLLEYLRTLTSQAVPGFGTATFQGKYGTKDRDQILTEIFDYIRCVDLLDPGVASKFTPNAGTAGAAQVVPIEDTSTQTRGFGRFPTIMGATLVFAGISTHTNPAFNPAPPANQIVVTSVLVPQFFDPSQGYPAVWHNYQIKISGLNNLKWDGVDASGNPNAAATPLFSSSSGSFELSHSPATLWGEKAFGGLVGAWELAAKQIWSPWSYPFTGSIINMKNPELDAGGMLSPRPTFQFTGGEITIELQNTSGITLQSVTLKFPSGTFPVPMISPSSVNGFDFRSFINNDHGRFGATNNESQAAWITTKDVVRSIVPAVGDIRMIMPRKTIASGDSEYSNLFTTHDKYADSTAAFAHNMRNGANTPYYMASSGHLLPLNYYAEIPALSGQYTSGSELSNMNTNFPLDSAVVPYTFANGVALGKTTVAVAGDLNGDWDNGVGSFADGPYINKADEGDSSFGNGNNQPYFNWNKSETTQTLFSPNRMMPSAGMFGSLPSGVWADHPWQTLLFRPGPTGHPGLVAPKDHLLLDLFSMPVVEPYAISEPLSTAGRINMNYQIIPFTYINRDTGIRAILKSEEVTAVPDTAANNYKRHLNNSQTDRFRLDVDADQTLKGFQQRFAAGDIFRSASEICDIHIVPQGATYADMSTYWDAKRLTGDNSRERPYTTIYPRLTTKSNTFSVHFRVQSLLKLKGSDPATWNESSDVITGEFRGSQTIDHYIDPNDTSIPDYAVSANAAPISSFYKFRVIQTKQFAP